MDLFLATTSLLLYCQSKISNFHHIIVGEQHVSESHISVNDAQVTKVLHASGDLVAPIQQSSSFDQAFVACHRTNILVPSLQGIY